MIQDGRALEAEFVPKDLQHRDAELSHIESILRPVVDGAAGETIIVTGPSGCGKTVTTRYVANQLTTAAPHISAVHINCWRNHTDYGVHEVLLDAIGKADDLHRTIPHQELISRLERYSGDPVVVILDEADQLDSTDIFYTLHSLREFSPIIIANDADHLFARVNNRLQSRLKSSEHVPMTKYNSDELVSILFDRARVGLTQDAASRSTLERIADAAAGDARVAIGMLKRAATIAARDDEDAITPSVLEEALPDAELEIRHRDVETLNAHQKAVFEIIRDHGPITPKRLYDRYEARADNPNKRRTVRSYFRKLAQYDLTEADGQTRDRTYIPIILAVEPVRESSAWDENPPNQIHRVVRRLVRRAQELVPIETVLCDSEFDAKSVYQTLSNLGVNYLIPKRTYSAERAAIETMNDDGQDVVVESTTVHTDQGSHAMQFLYVPSTKGDGTAVFATNRRVGPAEAEAFCQRYSRRWQIESDYNSIKNDFLAKTSSKDYRIRLFYFVFAVLLHNIWRLTDFLLKARIGGDMDYAPVLTAGECVELVSAALIPVD